MAIIDNMFIGDIILNVYPYGSKVYDCNKKLDSDEDVIVVVDDPGFYKQTGNPDLKVDITYCGADIFQKMLNDHDISALECYFLPEEKIIKNTIVFNFNLNLSKLRESISKISSNSFVKCKKKFTVKEDYNPYIAKKSLFHSLRIIMFGIQIAKYGKIVDYQEANYLWNEIVENENNDWEYYKEKYQPVYNKLKTEFRALAQK